MAQAKRATIPMTVDEFRSWAARQPGKWELVHGEPRAMAPASVTHSLLQFRAGFLIEQHLERSGSPCRIGTEVAIIPASFRRSNARSADVALTCTPPVEDGLDMAAPTFILEVLSPSNEQDTRDNVFTYMTIESVRQILMLQSTRVEGETFARGPDGRWPDEATPLGPDDTVTVDAVGFSCRVREFYDRTNLATP